MRYESLSVCVWFVNFIVCCCGNDHKYVNEWLLEVPQGLETAKDLADEYGFQLVKQYSETFPDVFVFRSVDGSRRFKRRATFHTDRLHEDARVSWAEQQIGKVRQKRDYIHREIPTLDPASNSPLGSPPHLANEDILPLQLHPMTGSKARKIGISSVDSGSDSELFNDPMWSNQWYIVDGANEVTSTGRAMRSMSAPNNRPFSLNVYPVWQAGITGHDVVVTILDDGVETNHTDLVQNYDPQASTDINGDDRDPTPRYDNPEDTHHGTRCAGEVAMQANNNICGVGIAYNAKIGGIRMLDGAVTDRVEAEAFSFNNNYIDIYSSSWGPSDDGKTVEAPGLMASRALDKGVTEGRQGKGVLYVWASGNGGISGDSCAYDGYASNINTIGIGSATEHGHFPIYGEICPSTMAVTYSSGSLTEGKIVSSDILNKCTTEHTGTSASAPLAAGIIALALEANPELSWRDMKHCIAWSADPVPLLNNPGWQTNGAGLLVSPAFGFGMMDADRLVKTAQMWKPVPVSVKCVVRKTGIENLLFNNQRSLQIAVRTQACVGTPNEINHLEQVQLVISLAHTRRGAVRIFLTSPMGTKTLMAPRRDLDNSSDGLNDWPFLSVHNWGEKAFGTWTVTLESHLKDAVGSGSLLSLRLIFHGTKDQPQSVAAVKEWRRTTIPESVDQNIQSSSSPSPPALIAVAVPSLLTHGNISMISGIPSSSFVAVG